MSFEIREEFDLSSKQYGFEVGLVSRFPFQFPNLSFPLSAFCNIPYSKIPKRKTGDSRTESLLFARNKNTEPVHRKDQRVTCSHGPVSEESLCYFPGLIFSAIFWQGKAKR